MKGFLVMAVLAECSVFYLKTRKTQLKIQGVEETIVNDYFDEYYYMDIAIGKAEQEFSVLIDINSPYFWVSDTACEDCEDADNFYNQSQSFNVSTSFFNDSALGLYGGKVVDRVKLSEKIVLNECNFISALNVSYFGMIGTDGVLGLAPGTNSSISDNLVTQMVKASIIEKPSFSLYFSSNVFDLISTTDPPATVIFGGYDDLKYSLGEMTFIKAKPASQVWESDLSSIVADFPKASPLIIRNDQTSVIFDTSINFISLPTRDYNLFYEKVDKEFYCVNAAHQLLCTCSSLTEFPSLTFTIDGYDFSLEPQDYLQSGSYLCRVLINKNDEEKVRLGLPFFRKFYSFFDYDKKFIGFGPAVKSVIVVLDGESSIGLVSLGVLGLACLGLYVSYTKNGGIDIHQNYRKI